MRPPPAPGPGIALRDYGLAELATAIDDLALRGGRVHEGIHQARKALRRTRALLSLGRAVLGPGATLVDRELRAANRRLSPLRDAHALVETLDRMRRKARDDATCSALDQARRIAARRRAKLACSPDFVHALQHEQAIVATLRAALLGLAWSSMTSAVVDEAMDKAWRKASAARDRALAHDHADDWHRWRRRMRRISQQQRAALAAGLPVRESGFDKHVAEQLGVLQDLSLLLAHCGEDSPFPASASTLRRFAARTRARQRKRIRSVVAPRVSSAP